MLFATVSDCRSGQYVYKPTLNRTCCPQYPIRCTVSNLVITKSQKKAIKRMNRYLATDVHCGADSSVDDAVAEETSMSTAGTRCDVFVNVPSEMTSISGKVHTGGATENAGTSGFDPIEGGNSRSRLATDACTGMLESDEPATCQSMLTQNVSNSCNTDGIKGRSCSFRPGTCLLFWLNPNSYRVVIIYVIITMVIE